MKLRKINKLSLALIAGFTSSILISHPTYAATLGQNLIVNGDAEQGAGDPIGNAIGSSIPLIPGWTTEGDFSVIKYGATGFTFTNPFGNLVSVTLPSTNVPGPTNRGNNLFFGGASRASSKASQSIDVSNLASIIDGNKAAFDLAGWLGGYATDEDIASLQITFLNQTNNPLVTASISAPSPAARNNITGLFLQTTQGFVPVGTRKIDVVLNAAYARGRVNDSYADNLSLVITQVPEPSVSSLIFISGSCIAVLKLSRKRQINY